jgi:hypothetical protein
MPLTHTPFEQQPFLQLNALQVDWHWWFWHVSFDKVQSWHALPPPKMPASAPVPPQSVSCVPLTHTLPAQQPLAHENASQVWTVWHEPLWHCAAGNWFAQFAQVLPFTPHAVFCVPIAQMSPTQQPAHESGPHEFGLSSHWPSGLHDWFGPHCWQMLPFAPQKSADVLLMQTSLKSPRQQPPQLVASHWNGMMFWHVRAFGWPSGTHCSSNEQTAHACPRTPQALRSVPLWQIPFASQQPPQLAALHPLLTPSQRPPVPAVTRQTSPASHFPHWPPFAPHANAELPGKQRSPTQQPVQFEASHFDVPHWRVVRSHALPCSSQSVQACAFVPHAVLSVPARHCGLPAASVVQQPFGQLLVLQTPATVFPHTRESVQVSKPCAVQSLHAPPIEPHAFTRRPVWHTPNPSQHPFAQLDGPQVVGFPLLDVFTTEASRSSGSRLDRPQPGATSMRMTVLKARADNQRSKARIGSERSKSARV